MRDRKHNQPTRRRFIPAMLLPLMLAALLGPLSVQATCVDYASYPHLVTGGPTEPREITSMASFGNYVYVARPPGSVYVWDMNDPTAPEVDDVFFIDGGECVTVWDHYAYVGGSSFFSAIRIYDVSNPAESIFLGNHNTQETVMCLDASPNFLVGGTHGWPLYIWERWPDPTDLHGVERQDSSHAKKAVAIDDAEGYLYVALDGFGLQVYDLWDAMPSVVDEVSGFYITHDVEVAGDLVFLTGQDSSGDGYLTAFDASDPTDLAIMSSWTFDQPAHALHVVGNTLVVANGMDGLRLFDLAGSEPVEGAQLPTPQIAMDLADGPNFGEIWVGQYLNGGGRLDLVRIPAAAPLPLTQRATVGEAYDIVAAGTDLFISTNDALVVYDDDGVTLRGSMVSAVAYDSEVQNGYLYHAAGSAGLRVIDIHDPTAPFLAGEHLSSAALGIGLGDGYYCVADENEGILVFQSGPVTPPAYGGTVSPPGSFTYSDVACRNEYAYAVGRADFGSGQQGGIHVIKVLDPFSPVSGFQYAGPSVFDGEFRSAAVEGDHLYVVSLRSLHIYDLSSPQNPTLVGSAALPLLEYGFIMPLTVTDGIAYVTDLGFGTAVYDCSDPTNPVGIGILEGGAGESITSHAVADNGVFLMDFYTGLWKAPHPCTGTSAVEPAVPLATLPALRAPFPNPFNPQTMLSFVLEDTRRIRLTIHDLAGRRVATLAQATLAAGEYRRAWRGKDDSGRVLAAGTYVARLDVEGQVSTQKLTLVK
jgi:hypothetical protein